MRRRAWSVGALTAVALAGCLPDGTGRSGLSAYNVDADGLALHGYSPVSYVDLGRAQPGSAEHERTYRGIKYLFVDDAQAAKFRADPGRYEPAFGGWCAYGMTLGIRWDPDPEAFRVIDGHLLLFSRTEEADARELWDRESEPAELLRRATHYWESLTD